MPPGHSQEEEEDTYISTDNQDPTLLSLKSKAAGVASSAATLGCLCLHLRVRLRAGVALGWRVLSLGWSVSCVEGHDKDM